MVSCPDCRFFEETTDYHHGNKYSSGFNCTLIGEWFDWFDMPEDCEFFDGDE